MVVLQKNSKAYLLSLDKKTKKLAQRLTDYCLKAEACHYDVATVQKLREQYKDVV